MKYSTAVKVAVDCMDRRRRIFAFDANLKKKLGISSPSIDRAAKHYDRITEAIEVLEKQDRLL